MPINPQLNAYVSHAVSQLSYRWLPLAPHVPSVDERFDASALSLKDWHVLIESALHDVSLNYPWVKLIRKKALSPIGIATVIYDNLCKARTHGAVILDFYHPAYPYLLRHIPDPPNCLTVSGNLDLLLRPKLALIGSRKASAFALHESQNLASQLAQAGAVVVSGGAIGCDAAAHVGALQSSIQPVPTVVVFAGGLSKLHPRCLNALFTRLRASNAIFMSERLWDFPARPMDFPVRNRIIAGLSSRILVMQAAERSGALHTAAYALDQGRDVYVLVHDPDDIRTRGSHTLLEQGASPFLSAEDFMSLPQLF